MVDRNKVVIVGAGHNGLVTAGYLARAGLDVEVLERRDVVGGTAVTEEWFPGFHISTCSYICHILQKKVIDDLELRRYGFYVYSLDPARIFPFPNGNVIRLWHDDARTADEIREFSPHDADSWTEWADFWTRSVRILSDYYLTTPPSLAELSARFRDEGEEELLETLLTVPLRDLIDWYFESEEVRAMVSTGSFAWVTSVRLEAPISVLCTGTAPIEVTWRTTASFREAWGPSPSRCRDLPKRTVC